MFLEPICSRVATISGTAPEVPLNANHLDDCLVWWCYRGSRRQEQSSAAVNGCFPKLIVWQTDVLKEERLSYSVRIYDLNLNVFVVTNNYKTHTKEYVKVKKFKKSFISKCIVYVFKISVIKKTKVHWRPLLENWIHVFIYCKTILF